MRDATRSTDFSRLSLVHSHTLVNGRASWVHLHTQQGKVKLRGERECASTRFAGRRVQNMSALYSLHLPAYYTAPLLVSFPFAMLTLTQAVDIAQTFSYLFHLSFVPLHCILSTCVTRSSTSFLPLYPPRLSSSASPPCLSH